MSINYDGSSTTASASLGNDPENPLLNKQARGSGSLGEAVVAYMNLVKVCIGAGVLALPYAFNQGGLILGSVGMTLIALWNYYTTCLLLKCKDRCKDAVLQLRKEGSASSTFSALAFLAFGKIGTKLVDISLTLTLLGVGVTYQIQTGTLLDSCGFISPTPFHQKCWTLVCTVIILPLTWLDSVSYLARTSFIALLALMVGFGCIFAYGAQEFGLPASSSEIQYWPDNLNAFSVYFGCAAFSFGVPTVIFPVQEGMKHPEHVYPPLKAGLFTVLLIYMFLGAFGMLLYLGDSEPINQIIILNLPQDSATSTAVKVLNAIVATFSYPLVFYPIAKLMEGGGVPRWRAILQRTFMVAITTAISLFAPWFGLVVALIGCFTVSLLSFIFPPIAHLKLCRADRTTCSVLADYASCFLGTVVCVVTTFLSIRSIATSSSAGNGPSPPTWEPNFWPTHFPTSFPTRDPH
jgi:amino acid permease